MKTITEALSIFVTSLFAAATLFPIIAKAESSDKAAPYTVGILLFDEVEIIDFTGPYEIFHQAGFQVYTVSEDGKPVMTVADMHVTPSHSFATLPDVDAILVPGGDVRVVMKNKAVHQWLTGRLDNVSSVMSVCTGSHILAEAGILDGLTATTFHGELDDLEEDYPEVTVVADKRWVDNGKVITTAGLSSGLDGAIHLVSKVKGMDKARELALHLEYDWDPVNGFVRGVMADKHYPANKYQWPEGIKFNRLISIGDKQHWQQKYHAQTGVTAEELLNVYVTAMQAHKNWAVEAISAREASWLSHKSDGVWRNAVSITPAGKNEYTLTLDVTKQAGD